MNLARRRIVVGTKQVDAAAIRGDVCYCVPQWPKPIGPAGSVVDKPNVGVPLADHWTGTLRKAPPGSTKNNSRPSRRQTGCAPPAAEMVTRLAGPDIDRADTSARPDSFDTYATHWPAGDIRRVALVERLFQQRSREPLDPGGRSTRRSLRHRSRLPADYPRASSQSAAQVPGSTASSGRCLNRRRPRYSGLSCQTCRVCFRRHTPHAGHRETRRPEYRERGRR